MTRCRILHALRILVELPDNMPPIAAWRPAWVCLPCGEDVGLDDIDVHAEAGNGAERSSIGP